MNRFVVLVASMVSGAGCGSGDSHPDLAAPVVRDSAGVRIVENTAPDPDSRLSWRLGEAPLLSIGGRSGSTSEELFRVEDALRLADGRILVANGGTSEVRVYDQTGVLQATWGREGEGPGEFTGLTDLTPWPGDSLMAWDFSQNRLTVFDLNGGVARTQRLTLGEGRGAGRFEGILGDGTLITASLLSFNPGDRTVGLVRRSRVFVRVDGDGERLTDFGEYPDEEYYVRAEVGAVLRHPFRRSVHSTIWNGRIVISLNDRYEIRAYDPDGSLAFIVRREHVLREVTQADVDEYVADRLAAASPEDQPTIARVFDGVPPVESFPAFAALIVDEVGDLWVREYARPGVERFVWTVFASDGGMRGLMETPVGLTVYRIGQNYILGKSEDELGVEQVQLWRLDRSNN